VEVEGRRSPSLISGLRYLAALADDLPVKAAEWTVASSAEAVSGVLRHQRPQ